MVSPCASFKRPQNKAEEIRQAAANKHKPLQKQHTKNFDFRTRNAECLSSKTVRVILSVTISGDDSICDPGVHDQGE